MGNSYRTEPLREGVTRLLKAHPRLSIVQLAAELSAKPESVKSALRRLRAAGIDPAAQGGAHAPAPAAPAEGNPTNGSRWSQSMAGHFAASRAARSGYSRDVSDDMRGQIERFDPRLIKRLPARYADGAEAGVGGLTSNLLIRAVA